VRICRENNGLKLLCSWRAFRAGVSFAKAILDSCEHAVEAVALVAEQFYPGEELTSEGAKTMSIVAAQLTKTLATLGFKLIGGVRLEGSSTEGVADLAHVNRVSIMGELAATLAHEVKQSIGTARNNARAALNFLDKQPPDLTEVREALDCVVADADRAGEIIDRVRDQIKKAPPRKDRFDLNKAITEVIELAEAAIARSGVSVHTRLAEELLPVQGDRVQLQQVVLNLILNAIEAMGSVAAGTRDLLISTEQSQTNDLLVAVRDSGPGIDPAHLERMFEAYYTTKSDGIGMGLSICQSIIGAHGGRLWAEANEPKGAIFHFTIPTAEKEVRNSSQAQATGDLKG